MSDSVSAITDVFSFNEQRKDAAQAKKRAAERTARELTMQAAENAEAVRRRKNEQNALEGKARSLAAGTGLSTASGSLSDSITDLATENKKQMKWLKTAGVSKVASIHERGSEIQDTLSSKKKAATIGLIGSGVKAAASSKEDQRKMGIWG